MKTSIRTTLRFVSVTASLGLLAAFTGASGEDADSKDIWEGGCFTVSAHGTTPGLKHVRLKAAGIAHTKPGDKFCLEEEGKKWYFEAGKGMENWKATTGGSRIPMTLVNITPTMIHWKFDLDVTNHCPTSPKGPGQHGRKHSNDAAFRIQVHHYEDPYATYALIIGAGNGGGPGCEFGPYHGGSAHANYD